MRRFLFVTLLAAVVLAAVPRPASADATAFLGLTTTPSNRSTPGFALGFGLLIVGFEFEYSSAAEDAQAGVPSLRTGSFNGLLQTPVAIMGMQFYGTAGAGIYREVLASAATTNAAINVGGGVKINVFGPIRLRIDYRVFKLSGTPLYSHTQRLYAGLNLKF